MELFVFIAIVLLSAIAWILFLHKKLRHSEEVADNTAEASWSRMRELNKEIRVLEERVLELENGIENQFGISVRQEVTKVECIFDKTEMAFLMAGVYELINEKGSSIEDKEYYIKLYNKIRENTELMEDPKDES